MTTNRSAESTAWADGYGFDAATVEFLTEIAAEADDRGAQSTQLDLATGDLSEWAVRLDDAGFRDLADRVRALPVYQ